MKLLNLNVGIKIDNLEKVQALIASEKADFCALQEVMNAVDDSCYDMFRVKNTLEKLKDYPHSNFAPLFIARGVEHNGEITFDFGGKAEQGCMLLSKAPIKDHKNEFYYNEYRYNYDATNFKTEEWCRSIENAILDINGKSLQIINVHGLWNKDKVGNERTLKQIDFILSRVRKDIPCIVVGDFNLLPTSDSIKVMDKSMRNLITEYGITTTRPAEKGYLVCDYVFVNDLVKVNDLKVLDSDASDHLPLLFDFEV